MIACTKGFSEYVSFLTHFAPPAAPVDLSPLMPKCFQVDHAA